MQTHEDYFNRAQNIITALENLMVQVGEEASGCSLFRRLRVMREVYEHEMHWHRNQMPLEKELPDHFADQFWLQNNRRKG